jgi:lipoyl(octanoyl) transferase
VSSLQVCQLGRQPYELVWRAMQAYTDQRGPDSPDQLWLVEHDPVFTLGQAGKPEHVLLPGDIPVVRVDRGGQVTYHGPGQLVAYPLLDLRRLGIGVRELVCRIETATIDALAQWGVKAHRVDGAPGIYVEGAKVMALGLRVRRGCSFHGLAFNVAMDLSPYVRINPCGYQGLAVTQLLDLGGPDTLEAAAAVLVSALARVFGLDPVETPAPDLTALAAQAAVATSPEPSPA